MSNKIQTEKDVMALIQGNIHREDFRKYLGLCVQKWERLKVELEIIDAIIASICKHWGISREELMQSSQHLEPRSLMYYIIKKEIAGLSYGEIGDLFGRPKSYIHKAVDDMVFFVEQKANKSLVRVYQSVQVDIHGENSEGGSRAVVI